MTDKITCVPCGVERASSNYYGSSSLFYKRTGRVPICKKCIQAELDGKEHDLEHVKKILRLLDKPFLKDLFQSSIEEASKKGSSNTFGTYLKNLGMTQYRELTWEHSDKNAKGQFIEDVLIQDDEDIEVTQKDKIEMAKFWGRGFSTEDLLWLQNEFEDFITRYECDSKTMELLFKQICLTELDIEKRRSNNEKVDAQLKTLQDLLGSSNLKPNQETGANSTEQQTFGTWIKKFENDRPIPEPDPQWKDVSGIRKYMNVWFFGHLARMMGIKNDHSELYEKEVSKYKVELDQEEDEKLGSD